MELGPPDDSGRRRPVPVQGSEFVVDVDTIIPAIGQIIDPALWDSAQDLGRTRRNTIYVDPISYATSIEGVFSGGDAGHRPRDCGRSSGRWKTSCGVHHPLHKRRRHVRRAALAGVDNPEYPPIPNIRPEARAKNPELTVPQRTGFQEVEQAFSEDEAVREANRCLNCGVCSECMECVKACPAEAVDHTMQDDLLTVKVGTIILSTGTR